MQDTEFTIEEVNGVPTLYFLPIRDGKRSAKPESVIAYNLVKEGILTKEERRSHLQSESGTLRRTALPADRTEDRKAATQIAKGSAASPGAACGKVCFTQDEALVRFGVIVNISSEASIYSEYLHDFSSYLVWGIKTRGGNSV